VELMPGGKVDQLKADFQWAMKRAKNHLKKHNVKWEANRQLMFGRIGGSDTGTYRNTIAEVYGTYRTLVSNIVAANPEVLFEHKGRPDLDEITKAITHATNYDFRVGKLRQKLVRALWQNFPYGLGIIAENCEAKKIVGEDGEPEMIEKLSFSWKNLNPNDVMFDPDGFEIGLEDHRFIFLAYYPTVKMVKNSKEYYNKEKVENFPRANPLSKTDRDKYFRSNEDSTFPSDAQDKAPESFHQFKMWRMYDRENEIVVDMADADSRVMRDEPWPMKIEVQGALQFPIHILAMNTESDDFYPTAECDLVRSQLAAQVKLTDTLITDLTTKIRRYVGLSPYMTNATMGKLLDPKLPNSFVVSSNLDVTAAAADLPKVDDASHLVAKIADIEPSDMLIPGIQEMRNQLTNILGYSQPGRAGGPQVRTAKEAARIADQMQRSLMQRQVTLEDLIKDMAIYHVQLLKASSMGSNLVEERYYPVTDRLSSFRSWQAFDPNEIPDEKYLAWDVFSGSSTPKTLDAKVQQFMQEFQVIAPVCQAEGYSLIPLINRYAEIAQVRDPDEFFRNQKAAARMFLASIVRASQMGAQAPPELLLKPGMDFVNSVLNQAEQQAVLMAMNEEEKKQGGAGGGANDEGSKTTPQPKSKSQGDGNTPESISPF
jgi:hypothetical protein